jgi:hypothetical protein
MRRSRICTVMAAAIITALPGAAAAQFPPPPGAPSAAPVQDRWPDPQRAPQAERAPAPAPRPAPQQRIIDAEEPLQTPAAPRRAAAPAAPATTVACNGVFAKDSTHLKLAIKYDSRNITYGQVDGPEGSKIPGSILYPNDPKRRLEVLWANDAGRSGTSVIAINGKSQWTAPKGLKLGMPLAAVEKLNGRPFKLSGFDADGTAGVVGWEGGALASLPGGCKMGIRVIADAKAAKDARDAVSGGDKEFLSNDAGVRALKPGIQEILIGY